MTSYLHGDSVAQERVSGICTVAIVCRGRAQCHKSVLIKKLRTEYDVSCLAKIKPFFHDYMYMVDTVICFYHLG